MTFAEAMQRTQSATVPNEPMLGVDNFTLWNQPSPPVPSRPGLFYTPP